MERFVPHLVGLWMATVLGGVALRGVLRATAMIWMQVTHTLSMSNPPALWVDVVALVGAMGVGLVSSFVWQRSWGRTRGIWRVVAVGLGLINLFDLAVWNYRSHMDFLSGDFVRAPEVGHYPHHADSIYETTRNGYTGRTRILPDGTRRCGPEAEAPPEAKPVLWVGDSMVFGLTVQDAFTPCWLMREHLEAKGFGPLTHHNWGQPGASIFSYHQTLSFALTQTEPEAVVLGLLIPNDSQVADVNHHRTVVHHPVFHLLTPIFGPQTLLSLVIGFGKVGTAELYDYHAIRVGMERLVALTAAHDLPMMFFVFGEPSGVGSAWRMEGFDDYFTQMAEQWDHVTYAGVSYPPVSDGEVHYRVPGDGHPTEAGARVDQAFLAPHMEAFLTRHLGGAP